MSTRPAHRATAVMVSAALAVSFVLFAGTAHAQPPTQAPYWGTPTLSAWLVDGWRAEGDFIIFAEERAFIDPAPAFRVGMYGTESPFALVASKPPYTTVSNPGGVDNRLVEGDGQMRAYMNWSLQEAPMGAEGIDLPQMTTATSDGGTGRFVLDKLRFNSSGKFRLLFSVSLLQYEREEVKYFNWTFNVDRQPSSIVLTTQPGGYNGTTLFPPPECELRDVFGRRALTPTPLISMAIELKPHGATITNIDPRKPRTTGVTQFEGVVVNVPGRIVYRMVATLSDGSQLMTPRQTIDVQRALPEKINVLQRPEGMSRFYFFKQPVFSIEDSIGASHDERQNMTLKLTKKEPSVVYTDQDTNPQIVGNVTIYPDNYLYKYKNLFVTHPGRYTVTAALKLAGLQGAGAEAERALGLDRVVFTEPPTWLLEGDMKVNSDQSRIFFYGDRPDSETVLVQMSDSSDCTSQASNQLSWPSDVLSSWNVSIVPYKSGNLYVCMKVDSQPFYGRLYKWTRAAFNNELREAVTTVTIGGVSTCQPLNAYTAERFRAAGWDTAESGREYGCALEPPVAGSIPPCSCPGLLRCTAMRHEKFTPPNVNIGQCACCATIVMVIASGACAVAFAVFLAIIYFFV